MTTPPALLDTALAWHAAGASVVPTRTDGSKAPAAFWAQYQQQRPDEQQLRTWFASGDYDGFGIITGVVSGNIEMLEIEGRATHLAAELATAMTDNGLADLWRRVTAGYLETTPSGGYHWLYRVDGQIPGNTKLARRPSTPQEFDEHIARLRADAQTDPNDDVRARRLATIDRLTPARVPQVLIETRGEGGFTVLAPSSGRTHPTGKAWTHLIGGPDTLPTITLDEREALHAVAAMFDQMPPDDTPAPVARTATTSPRPDDGDTLRPGDDYNARATWDDILTPHGWTKGHRLGPGHGWTRPGKSPRDGISATTGQNDGDNLYVFTTSTVFEEGRPYSKFAAYTLLEHGGDYPTAARELARQGYGRRAERPRPTQPTDDLDGILLPTTPATDGATALAPHTEQSPRPQLTVVQPTTYTETDDGNALRLIDTHHDHIRYIPQRGQWLTWHGHRWTWDDAGHVRELARNIARTLPDDDKPAEKHRKYSLSRRGIEAMTALAQSDPRAVTHLAALDARPYELNTPAGVVNLRTGHLHPPDPAALHTRTTTVAPDPHQPTPRWTQYLADTFAGDPDTIVYVQRLLGVSLVGTVLEQLLPFAFGPGANGKSVLFETVQDLAGIGDSGYAASIPADMLVARAREDHPATIAQLAGVRIAIGGELEQGARFAEAKVKQLTGGDPINARFMGKNPFTFVPTHTLWLHANHEPEVRAGGEAFWRRIRQIPFLHTVPEEKRVKNLREILVNEEGPGILSWILTGAADYFTHGITTPASVTAATASYQHETDTVAQFVEERCETGPANAQHMHVRTTTLRQAYETWCHAEGLEPVSARSLTQQLKARYSVASSRSSQARFYDGIRLTEASSDDDDPSPEVSSPGSEYGW
ncbi:phage/plasmid primase, P4 family, C-terminal domain-containing protein [Georgenia satyanarayanai]|uniref:Phage/plasmid primase, P4 family, C-terminal domain-containing protein n=1 Tax=Georgenia satyanarayanai TaxID=860221 RepID=A0A2Y9A892_9MICO|nr:phage/plasmid primase, P4 family [Georgenia satyanarayanai]PYG00182.1 P4 family phage/plasmid primase-like protein [Georgenia satyanarayanai]SSA40415.1 phage/plasmid primase, P4 family, C-terminal domain-containing protein [Georgenia satyanarayanai]